MGHAKQGQPHFPEIHYGVLYEQFYESGSYDLMDMRTGKMMGIDGDAVPSPDKRRLAVFATNDFTRSDGTQPPGFAVYFIADRGLVEEFRVAETSRLAEWKDDRTIDITFSDEAFGDRKPTTLTFISRDTKVTGKWKLAPISDYLISPRTQ